MGIGGTKLQTPINYKKIKSTVIKYTVSTISITIICASIALIYSFYIAKPIYEAETQLLINQKNVNEEVNYSQSIETDLQLINTYTVIIESPVIIEQVIKDLNLNISEEELINKITIDNVSESKVITIKVTDEIHYQAVEIANSIGKVVKEEIPNLMSIDNINILSPAKHRENPNPVSPNISLNIAIAITFGILLGVGISFLREYFDTSIKNEKDLEELLELPILGVISTMPENK